MRRVLVIVSIPFLASTGIALALFLEGNIAPWVCMGILLAVAVGVAVFPFKKVKIGDKTISRIAVVTALLFAAFGFARVGWHMSVIPNDAELDGKTGMVLGTLKSVKPSSAQSAAYRIRLTKTDIEGLSPYGDVIVYGSYREDLRAGDVISLSAQCISFTSTPTLDFERFYNERGVYLLLKGKSIPELYGGPVFSLSGAISDMSDALLTRVDRYLEEPYSGMLKAMLLGDSTDFNSEIYRSVTRSGVNHLFTVSGLHVTTLSGFLLSLLILFRIPRRLRAIIAIACTWVFAAVTGFGVSACRAALTVTVLLAGELVNRPTDSLNSLCGAAFLLVLINPACITQTSFLLTFSATAGVVLLQKPVSSRLLKRFNPLNRFVRFVLDSFATTAAVTLAMLPVLIPLFGGTSLLAPVLNLLLVPLLPFILTGGMLLLAVPFEAVAVGIGKGLEIIFAFIVRLCKDISELPFCYIGFDELHWRVGFWAVLILSLLSLLIFPAIEKNGGKTRPVFKSVVAMGLAVCLLTGGLLQLKEDSRLRITTFGGRDGAAAVIRVGKRTAIAALSDDDRVDTEIMTFLQGRNLNRVDCYVTLGEPPRLLEDTVSLSKQAAIDILMSPKEEESRLAERLMPYRAASLSADKGYLIELGDNFTVTAEGEGTESAVWIKAGETRICITSGEETAKSAKCEILIFGGDFSKIYKQISPKYVILLKEPSEEIDAEGLWKGYLSQYELVIRPDGVLLER